MTTRLLLSLGLGLLLSACGSAPAGPQYDNDRGGGGDLPGLCDDDKCDDGKAPDDGGGDDTPRDDGRDPGVDDPPGDGGDDPGNKPPDPATDSDLDGLSDTLEMMLGLDPFAADSDLDGLPDADELGDPQNPIDTDGDGKLDAIDDDSDNDGVGDADEFGRFDSDCDGIPEHIDPDFGPAGDCTINPGKGIGDLVLVGEPFSAVRARLGAGEPDELSPTAMRFLNGRLRVSFGDTDLSRTLNDGDIVISATARADFVGRLAEGIALGDPRQDTEALLRPEHTATIPETGEFPGGILGFYFTRGLSIGYRTEAGGERVSALTVSRQWAFAPSGSFDPIAGTVELGSARLVCGDGREGGEGSRPAHWRGQLGEADYSASREVEVSIADVQIQMEMYQSFGATYVWVDEVDKGFFGDEDPNELLLVFLFPPFFGKTAEGIGIGSTRAEVELRLNLRQKGVVDFEGHRLFTYETRGDKLLGVAYANDGESPNDPAVAFAVNMQEL